MKKILVGLAAIGTGVVAVPAHAALDLSTFTIDMAPAETLAIVVLGAIGTIFVIRKIVGLLGR